MSDAPSAPSRLSEFRENLYHLELEYCKHYKRDDIQADRVRAEIGSLMLNNCPKWNEWLQREIPSVFEIYGSINLSSETLLRLINVDAGNLSDITATSFSEAISYVGAVTKLDLSNVQEVRLDAYECDYVEGECVACNASSHHIYYSLESSQVSSVDLLIHELGHAADFTFARHQSDEDKALYRHQSLAEAVAYYCQYIYLIDHGNTIKRTGALGAFTYTYLAYLICRYCLEKHIPLNKLKPVETVKDELFSSFISAYSVTHGFESANIFITEKIREIQMRFPSVGNLIFEELSPRLGIPLGLALLAIEDLDLARISSMNSLDVELKQLLEKIDHRLTNKLSDMNTLITNFIDKVR